MARPPLFTRPFVLSALANLVLGIASTLFLHFPGLLKDLGAGETEIGWIAAVNAATAVVFGPWIGKRMDTHGRRRIILAGGLVNVASTALHLTIASLGPWVYVVRFLHGVAGALLYTSLFTYGADHVPPERTTEGLAIFGVSGLLPIAVGALLGDAILARASYAELFLASLALAVASLLMTLPLRDAVVTSPGEPPPRGFRAPLLQEDLRPVWLVALVFFVAMTAIWTFLKVYLQAVGFGTLGEFFSPYIAVAIALRLFLGWLPDRLGPKRVLGPALLLYALGLLALARASAASDVALAGLLCGAGHGYAFPILFGLVVRRARAAERGSAMAIYTAIDHGAMLVAAPPLGYLIEVSGYGAMFSSAAGAILLGTGLFFAVDRGRQ